MERRSFFIKAGKVLGGAALVAAGGFYLAKPKGESAAYSPFFAKLNQTLRKHDRAIPSLLIDLDALDHNMEELKKLIPAAAHFRVVAKSLPSRALIDYVLQRSGTKRLMVFHQPFLSEISNYADAETDILMGKPMPVQTAAYYYKNLKEENVFDPSKQLQWLVDTKQRIQEYIDLAKAEQRLLQLNIEIDVGLHRGGFDNLEELESSLALIAANSEWVRFSGFMGYDPHIVKVPAALLSREEAFAKMKTFYEECKALVRTKFPQLWHKDLTFNGAGSPTLALHNNGDSPLNDISAGSFAVKPTDFDIDTLTQFKPASYIATPILKHYKSTNLPSIEKYQGLLNSWDKNMENAYYIYGGAWMADYYEPKGIKGNPIFGKSTNQIMVNASNKSNLGVDDFVFLRPHQSEFVFLQFENIIAFRKDQIIENWDLL